MVRVQLACVVALYIPILQHTHPVRENIDLLLVNLNRPFFHQQNLGLPNLSQ